MMIKSVDVTSSLLVVAAAAAVVRSLTYVLLSENH